MSDQTQNSPELQTVIQAYMNKCASVGDAQFKIKALKEFIDRTNVEIAELDKKAFDIKSKELAQNTPSAQ